MLKIVDSPPISRGWFFEVTKILFIQYHLLGTETKKRENKNEEV